MSLREESIQPAPAAADRPLASLEARLTQFVYVDAEILAYVAIFILAVVTRFWDLGARVMSHDESLHTRYSWNLYKGQGFQHTPLMHGPLLFHMVALNYLLFGDNDFSARIYTAIVGIIVVMLPIFMRRWLGKFGALAASLMLLISPMIMYYSRYIREDMPAILGALLMVLGIWHYMEKRQLRFLLLISFGFAILFAQKEVSFIYVAIFGSFMTLYLISRLLIAPWSNRSLYMGFVVSLITTIALLAIIGTVTVLNESTEEAEPPVAETEAAEAAPVDLTPDDVVLQVLIGLEVVSILAMAAVVIIGQWSNLRRFPELDVAVVMGTLILPMLTPILIHAVGWNPMDQSTEGVWRGILLTTPVVLVSILVGVAWGMTPPERSKSATPRSEGSIEPDAVAAEEADFERDIDTYSWAQAIFTSRWLPIAAVFWVFFFFFFTTMFTNGLGIGTGVIASLGYWLEQQEVQRGNQPWYYYILLQVPFYEFLPMLLFLVALIAGFVHGIGRLIVWIIGLFPGPPAEAESAADESEEASSPPEGPALDLDAPVHFPIFLFTGYWAVMNFVAYSVAGEKMPWLTTHLTVPMIFIGGWLIGRLIERIEWRRLLEGRAWVVLLLLPLFAVSLLRVAGPLCTATAPAPLVVQPGSVPGEQATFAQIAIGVLRLPCTTIIPESYQQGVLLGMELQSLSQTSAWIAAVVILAGVTAGLFVIGRSLRFEQIRRLAALWIVAYLMFFTARTALIASFVNYDYATEYLVYAHSAGSVKQVLERIDEISLKTTDGYGLKVAYDNRVSWPYSWYFRNYYNAVYYGEQPSRGQLADAPVVLAGPDNWGKVEPLLGDRYYQFEYVRMWWPMQDYFDLNGAEVNTFFIDPELQRGIWDIFARRDYDGYADAVTKYRSARPDFSLSEWPVSERMRVYIRKDLIAEVWDYGVAASEIAAATDPYAEGVRQLTPANVFGSGALSRPHGSALGPDGNLYVADSANHRIAVFDTSGNLVRTIGQFGLAPQEDAVNEPWAVAVAPDGTISIADTWNHRVVQYSAEGEYLRTWGTYGPNETGNFAFWGPRGIAVDSLGNVYVSDTGNKRIMVYDAEGGFVRQIASGGGLDGQIDEPGGLAFGPDGLLYVADTWNQRISVFAPDGTFVRQWPIDAWYAQTNERPYLTVDSAGNVYVTDPDAYRVMVFDNTGQYQYSFGDYTTIGLAGAVIVDEQGILYLIDTSNGTIQAYNLEAQEGLE